MSPLLSTDLHDPKPPAEVSSADSHVQTKGKEVTRKLVRGRGKALRTRNGGRGLLYQAVKLTPTKVLNYRGDDCLEVLGPI